MNPVTWIVIGVIAFIIDMAIKPHVMGDKTDSIEDVRVFLTLSVVYMAMFVVMIVAVALGVAPILKESIGNG
jgi:hypothetical protein